MPQPARNKLTDEELERELQALPEWQVVSGKLHRKLEFESFIEAFAFMTKLALVAERLNHHPEWTNVYNRVELFLMTHDTGGISKLDCELARAADRFYSG